jgi:hypothetical protein
LTKKRREQFDESLHKLNELTERWDQRLTLDNLDLAKRYLKVELGVHVHLSYRVAAETRRDSVDYCAIFQRDSQSGPDDAYGPRRHVVKREAGSVRVGGDNLGHGVRRGDAPLRRADGHQELVFVFDVELVEQPEQVARSLVRFGLFDEVHRNFRRSHTLGGTPDSKALAQDSALPKTGNAVLSVTRLPLARTIADLPSSLVPESTRTWHGGRTVFAPLCARQASGQAP